MSAMPAYTRVTARAITPDVMGWIAELVERFGEDRVIAAIHAEATVGKFERLLGRVRDRLAREEANRTQAPVEVSRDELMLIVRGQSRPPAGPWIYDSRDLSNAEYEELLTWADERRTGRTILPSSDGQEGLDL